MAIAAVALVVGLREPSGTGSLDVAWPAVDPGVAELTVELLAAPEGAPVRAMRDAISGLNDQPTANRCEGSADELAETASLADVTAWAMVVPDETLGELVMALRTQTADLFTLCLDARVRLEEALEAVRTTDALVAERLHQLEEVA